LLFLFDVDGVGEVGVDWATYKLPNWVEYTSSHGLWEGLWKKSSCAKNGINLPCKKTHNAEHPRHHNLLGAPKGFRCIRKF
jgi:hypothetical protein